MTQPPDERPPRPDEPEGDAAPENAPTVAWTPPESEGEPPAPEAGTPPPPEPQSEPLPPVEPVEPAVPPAAAGGPIISATTTPPASGWQTPAEPAAPGVPPVVPPGGGWEMPTAVAALPQQQGYVIAGVGARIIAWLIDVTLAGIVPGILAFAVVDWTGIMREAIEQARLSPSGQITGMTATTIPNRRRFRPHWGTWWVERTRSSRSWSGWPAPDCSPSPDRREWARPASPSSWPSDSSVATGIAGG